MAHSLHNLVLDECCNNTNLHSTAQEALQVYFVVFITFFVVVVDVAVVAAVVLVFIVGVVDVIVVVIYLIVQKAFEVLLLLFSIFVQIKINYHLLGEMTIKLSFMPYHIQFICSDTYGMCSGRRKIDVLF